MFRNIIESARGYLAGAGRTASAAERVPLRSRAVGGRTSDTELSRVSAQSFALDAEIYPAGGLAVFGRMQRDAQVRACLTTKRLAVLSESVEVHAADESASA